MFHDLGVRSSAVLLASRGPVPGRYILGEHDDQSREGSGCVS
jgi:hypothetical protein